MRLLYQSHSIWRSLTKAAVLVMLFAFVPHLLLAQNCAANAGSLTAIDICMLQEQVILKAKPKGDATVPSGFQTVYVLTRGSELVIQQVSNTANFALSDTATGLYTIHTLVYNPATLNLNTIVLGQTTGFAVNALLVQGGGTICGALDVTGVKIRFGNCEDTCVASAGRLSASSNVCLRDSSVTLTATVQAFAIVPDGYTRLYVLTSGDGLVIEQVNTTPSFVVTNAGRFTIHTLVYDSTTLDLGTIEFGETTGFDVNALLIQGGGDICGALDVTGAIFKVEECRPACLARAGTLKKDRDSCLVTGKNLLLAKKLQNPTIPQGFQVRYLLSSGYGLVIQQIGTTPSFEVQSPGIFTIHTLVYNPATFNINTIKLGWSKVQEIRNTFTQNGICAALDAVGASFDVTQECQERCQAKAGTLKPVGATCLDGEAILKAKHDAQPVIPRGYEILYLLSYGEDLTVLQIHEIPQFTIWETGYYNIHALVYDPDYFDPETEITLEATTIFEIHDLFLQGGGDLCGALDLTGAKFHIEDCSEHCIAYAGRIFPVNSNPCLQGNKVLLKAYSAQYPLVPQGYQVAYLLSSSSGLLIEQIGATSNFYVNRTGNFKIHTLVYNPNTLNLNDINIGQTTVYDLYEQFVEGGGDICGTVDLTGASFLVKHCGNLTSNESAKSTAYPNPTPDFIYLDLENPVKNGNITIQLTDLSGKVLKTWNLEGGTGQTQLDIREFNPGMYHLRLIYDQAFVQQQSVIKM